MSDEHRSQATFHLRLTERQLKKLMQGKPTSGSTPHWVVGVCGAASMVRGENTSIVFSLHHLEPASPMSIDSLTFPSLGKLPLNQVTPIIFLHTDAELPVSARVQIVGKLLTKGVLIVQLGDAGLLTGSYYQNGNTNNDLTQITIAGSDIVVSRKTCESAPVNDLNRRFLQSFGSRTTAILSDLKVGVVGVSGTGSPVAELLYRLGVGSIVLVDDDRVEVKNLGRIINSTWTDAEENRLKVDVIGDAFERMGLPTTVIKVPLSTYHAQAVGELAQCDIVFGCMDTHSGRALLNRLSTFYLIPYFDLGVHLNADGRGSVNAVSGVIHYLQPDGSSLLSRKAINRETIEAEGLKRSNPAMYEEQKGKYITGVKEDRPAVVSINTTIASMAINDLLARLHPYRNTPNEDIATIWVNFREPEMRTDIESTTDDSLLGWLGAGDVSPPLMFPAIEGAL